MHNTPLAKLTPKIISPSRTAEWISVPAPTGNGIWPALWMLPQDHVYGTWATSGEIDVMEARGRLPGATSGAVHFGGQWPTNRHLSGEYHFPEGQTFANDYHVYSVVWEEDNIKWYVDGKFFFKVTRDQWYSAYRAEQSERPVRSAVLPHYEPGNRRYL